MTVYYQDDRVTVYHGDCIEVMLQLPDNSVDAVVTDPPYLIGFMGRNWDSADGIAGKPEVWREALRVLKPGGHLLAFGGTRTWHRLAVAIEDAGFEIRDNIARLHGDNRLCHCEFPDVIEWSYGTGEPQTEHDLRFVQHADLPPTVNAENKRGEVLQSEMSEHGTQSTSGFESEKGFENGKESGMEGRGNLQTTEGQLFGSEIRQGAGVGKTDGAQGRLHNGAPFSDGENVRIFTDSHGSGESHRSQPIKQQSGELGAVSNKRRSQARGSWPFCVRCGKPLGATESTHLAWVMGSGFPKSLDVSKAIDKKRDDRTEVLEVTAEIARLRDLAGLTNRDLDNAFGFAGMAGHWTSTKSQPTVPTLEQWTVLRDMLNASRFLDQQVWRLNGRKGKPGEAWAEREVVGAHPNPAGSKGNTFPLGQVTNITAPATPAAEQWQGWGTALKPAHEPIVVARKPLIGTVAENVLTHGTGALNIDGCRIGTDESWGGRSLENPKPLQGLAGGDGLNAQTSPSHTAGRWPANVILDESQAAELDKQSGNVKGGTWNTTQGARHFNNDGDPTNYATSKTDSTTGGASRFFYVAKANKKERPNVDGVAHPTVKPMALMQYLVRLVTPPGGTVLEPFAGSGTTIEAALNEGFNVIGIEMTDEYLPLIMSRIERYGDKLL